MSARPISRPLLRPSVSSTCIFGVAFSAHLTPVANCGNVVPKSCYAYVCSRDSLETFLSSSGRSRHFCNLAILKKKKKLGAFKNVDIYCAAFLLQRCEWIKLTAILWGWWYYENWYAIFVRREARVVVFLSYFSRDIFINILHVLF